MNLPTETHPLKPWLPGNARLLMCGTFPPARSRWSMEFYYPNFINDMWRIMGLAFHDDKDFFVDSEGKTFRLDAIKALLSEKGIALSDTGREVHRQKGNASDKHLDILKPIDLPYILSQLPECHAVATTGEKAATVMASLTNSEVPRMGECRPGEILLPSGERRELEIWRMPSTSRAYPLKIDKKAAFYKTMLRHLEMVRE